MCKKCDVCVKAIEIKIEINCERIQGSNDGLWCLKLNIKIAKY